MRVAKEVLADDFWVIGVSGWMLAVLPRVTTSDLAGSGPLGMSLFARPGRSDVDCTPIYGERLGRLERGGERGRGRERGGEGEGGGERERGGGRGVK